MTIQPLTTVYEFRDLGDMDAITTYFTDYELGRGMVTLVCYGNAWSSYFGAMGGNTIQEFFEKAGMDYLVNKLGNAQTLKQRKCDHNYLLRVIHAVKRELANADVTREREAEAVGFLGLQSSGSK